MGSSFLLLPWFHPYAGCWIYPHNTPKAKPSAHPHQGPSHYHGSLAPPRSLLLPVDSPCPPNRLFLTQQPRNLRGRILFKPLFKAQFKVQVLTEAHVDTLPLPSPPPLLASGQATLSLLHLCSPRTSTTFQFLPWPDCLLPQGLCTGPALGLTFLYRPSPLPE